MIDLASKKPQTQHRPKSSQCELLSCLTGSLRHRQLLSCTCLTQRLGLKCGVIVPDLFVTMSSTAQMDEATRAMCYALRHPGRSHKPMKYKDIRKVVKKTDKKRPSLQGIALAVAAYPQENKLRGRKKGWSKTSRDEDKIILKTFHQKRPPGCGVTSRVVHDAMPRPLRKKICKRTVIRRLAKKGSI